MCTFFSFCSDGFGKVYYFNNEQRSEISKRTLQSSSGKPVQSPDSHTSILDYYGIDAKLHSKYNCYEYIPISRTLIVDQMNTYDDSSIVEKWVKTIFRKMPLPTQKVILPDPLKMHTYKKRLENMCKKKRITRSMLMELIEAILAVGNDINPNLRKNLGILFSKLSMMNKVVFVMTVDQLERSSNYFAMATKFHMSLCKDATYKNGFYDVVVKWARQQQGLSAKLPV
jgi:hypothetical protein